MPPFFQQMFGYRERAEATPPENLLSDLLAELLKRLPPAQFSDFVSTLLLPPEALRLWRALVPSVKVFRFIREYWTQAGRIDILILGDDIPIIVVENKVTAPFSQRSSTTKRNGLEAWPHDHQLARYGKWLANNMQESRPNWSWPGAITLLTYAVPPPGDFEVGNAEIYGVPWQRTTRWYELSKWLSTRPEISGSLDKGDLRPSWLAMSHDFWLFLE